MEYIGNMALVLWISVKYQLPPPGERVLAYTNDGWMFIGKDFEVGDEISDEPEGVAFWAHLPNPPKKEETT